MYKSYYSFAHALFSKMIQKSDAFSSTDFQGATAALDYLRKTKGIGLLTGDPSAGKTFTLRAFKESLSPALYHVIYFPMSTGGVMDFYRALAYGLGEEPKFRKVDVFRQIQEGIERMATERKVTPVILLDEMHMAKDAFLQDIALLFNFQMDASNPFILVLAGLPHLKTKLTLNHHRPLTQRFVVHYDIQALSQEEAKQYIQHHLQLAGAKIPIFTEAALEAIVLRAQGWPRVINSLTVSSLLFGAQLNKEVIDEEIVRLAIEENVFT